MKVYKDIEEHIEKCVQACELELYGTELQPGSPEHTLRIYIDSPEQVNVDDCQRVGQYIRHYASVHCPSLLQHQIEISSPGLDRILFTLDHCKANLDKKVRCRTRTPIEDRRNFTGTLTEVNTELTHITLQIDQESIDIPWQNIDKIRLIYQPKDKQI